MGAGVAFVGDEGGDTDARTGGSQERNQHYGENRTNSWPFSVSKDVRDGRWYYETPENVAGVIKAIPR
jgi:hypothetical protein